MQLEPIRVSRHTSNRASTEALDRLITDSVFPVLFRDVTKHDEACRRRFATSRFVDDVGAGGCHAYPKLLVGGVPSGGTRYAC